MVKQVSKRVRLAQKRRRMRIIKLLLGIGCLILLFAGIILLSTFEKFSIKSVSVGGESSVSGAALSIEILKELASVRQSGLYAGTIFTYDKDAIINELKYRYPQLKDVEITTNGFNKLTVEIKERDPVAMWCSDDNMCYLLDKDGYIYLDITDKDSMDLVQFTGGGIHNPLRSRVLPGKLKDMLGFLDSIKSMGVAPKEISINQDTEEFLIVSKKHPVLRVRLSSDMEQVASYLKVVLDSKNYKEYANSVEKVEYIDLRFGNRVYYK